MTDTTAPADEREAFDWGAAKGWLRMFVIAYNKAHPDYEKCEALIDAFASDLVDNRMARAALSAPAQEPVSERIKRMCVANEWVEPAVGGDGRPLYVIPEEALEQLDAYQQQGEKP